MSTAILVGPGRAGLSLALAMGRAGHEIVGVAARDPDAAAVAAVKLGAQPLDWGAPLPAADMVVIGVRDDAISEVASLLGPLAGDVAAAVHLSGLAGLDALSGFGDKAIGSFHPLQTLPDADAGSRRLEGSWIAVDASDDRLRASLREIARSIGATPFDVTPEARAAYHAAAAATANFPVAAWAMAQDLFEAAGVPFEAAEPLARAVLDNAFAMGPRAALTGPVARGDVGTVMAQLDAVRRYAPQWEGAFRAFVKVLAEMTEQHLDLP